MCFCKGWILLRSDVKIVMLQKSNHKGKTVCRILVVITSEAQRKCKRMARLVYAMAYSFCVSYLRQNRLQTAVRKSIMVNVLKLRTFFPHSFVVFFCLNFVMKWFLKILSGMANSVPDQTAPSGAVWSGPALFAYAILLENSMCEIIGHLPHLPAPVSCVSCQAKLTAWNGLLSIYFVWGRVSFCRRIILP